MKKLLLIAVFLVSGVFYAQNEKPVLEQEGNLVKATYYYENGKVKQQGYFKDGKLEGQWKSFDQNGNKTAMGEYVNGEKTGKWFFWDNAQLSEVDYTNNAISSVKNWRQEALVNRN
jgi:antitoxin component YwqK of YwqJK toxin-antitoxin module